MEVSPNILIYNTTFFEGSETFIYNQYRALSDCSPLLVAHDFKNLDLFPLHPNTKKIVVSKIPLGIRGRLVHFLRRKLLNSRYLLPLSAERLLRNTLEGTNLIHAHFGPNALAILPFAKRNKLPMIVSFHGYDASQMLKDLDYVNQLNKLFEYVSSVIVCAHKMKRDLLSKTHEKFSEKIHVVHYGVDVDRIDAIQVSNSTSNPFTIIHAGRLTPKKGVLDLIYAFGQVKLALEQVPLRLEIIGDGEDLSAAKQLVKSLNLETQVLFFGAQSHETLLEKVKAADLFVLNSRVSQKGDSEGFPNSILEAMAAKTAVISTRHAGIPEVIFHQQTGLLVEERSQEELEMAIKQLIVNSDLKKRLELNAYKTVSKEFSIKSMNGRLMEIFKKNSDVIRMEI
jgi:glycosyltransferase involved in cell wall biosynthesis